MLEERAGARPGARPLLSVENLTVRYPLGRSITGRTTSLAAVNNVTFGIEAGKTLGLVGESGSGKSSIGRAILRLAPISEGKVIFDGQDVGGFGRRAPASYHRDMQVVFQDPMSSLNPRQTIGTTLGQGINRHRPMPSRQLDKEVIGLLDSVGLPSYHADRYPHELSGGQRQRVAIARALSTKPRLIVCDEAVSALDVSTQSQVINLLMELQRELGVSYLFIAHDLDVVRHVSDTIGVLYLGRLAELGPADEVYDTPGHPYTQTLLASTLVANPDKQAERSARRRELGPVSEPPSPLDPPPGCPFHTRCTFVTDVCKGDIPVLTTPLSPTQQVACYHGATVRG
ncbi:peptide/nickel transport system ATP-binding protein/oligopeptide transport system ATP-binding protein [Sinosporangium album]|uniref:Peptide/nickel transport system ATP-binding protein/oligopeptide transport system ATP-binding protein n=2 Tax=Sinosporangium album TaxID=504805 RepID=A0A1G8JI15_9ACTN|nr:peptide/nickel transport system ATP-binding protein/oligopeptide transport system ATP-binding protein [Sinosporangium album]